MIKLIVVGKIKEKYLKEAIDEYKKRLSKYTKLEIIEVNDYSENSLVKEKEEIIKHINKNDYLIALDIDGKSYTSLEFAQKIDNLFITNSCLTFIIGGSNGLDMEIKDMVNERLSFSKLTFPHQLFRVMLLEQIYRAYKINNNESYHK